MHIRTAAIALLLAAPAPRLVLNLLGPAIPLAASSSVVSKQDNGTAYNAADDEYFVVWNENGTTTQSDILAARIDAATGPVLASFPVANGADATFAPAVSWNPVNNTYLVAWANGGATFSFATESFTIEGVILGASGSIAVPLFTISTSIPALDDADGPRIAFDGAGWLVAWFTFVNDAGGTTLDNDIYARTIGPTGTPGALLPLEVGAGAKSFSPSIAFGPGGNHLVAWLDTLANAGDGGVFGRTVKASDLSLGTVFEYSDPATVGYLRNEPAVAAGATGFLVGWDEDDTNNGQSDVLAARADSSGAPAGAIIPVEVDVSQNSYHATIAWSAPMSQFVFAWYHDASFSFTYDIAAVRIDASGAVLDATPISVATPGMSNPNSFYPQASIASRSGTGQVLLCWRVYGTTPLPLDAQRLDLNTPPDDPLAADLAQDQGATFAAADPAGTTYTSMPRTMTFRSAAITDPDGHDVRLEIEHVVESGSYGAVATGAGTLGPSGTAATATISSISNGSFKWRARAVDALGGASGWVAFDAPAGFDFAFLATTTPAPPALGPAGVNGQFRADGTTSLALGELTPELSVVIRATLAVDPDGDLVRLEVEVQPVGTAFTGVATGTSAFGPPGSHQVAVTGLATATSYHWQALCRDNSGAGNSASAPVAFGGNSESSADFSTGQASSSSRRKHCGIGASAGGSAWLLGLALAAVLLALRRR